MVKRTQKQRFKLLIYGRVAKFKTKRHWQYYTYKTHKGKKYITGKYKNKKIAKKFGL